MKGARFTIILAAHCWGQASSGSLIGEVADDNSMQLSDISITLQRGTTGFSHSAVTGVHDIGVLDTIPTSDFFYGKAFSAGNPRRMQFALRYDF